MTPARLSSSRDIQKVLVSGRSAGSSAAVVALRQRGDDDAARVAVVAGRKVGGAVQRNRAKRRLRAAATLVTWPAGADAVLRARHRALDAPFDQLVVDVSAAVRRAGRDSGQR